MDITVLIDSTKKILCANTHSFLKVCFLKVSLHLLNSINTHAPYLNILIADDSEDYLKINKTFVTSQFPLLTGQIDVFNKFPDFLGTSRGRNFLLKKAENLGYKYIFMTDDDYQLTSADTITDLVKIYIQEAPDIIAPARHDYGTDTKKDGTKTLKPAMQNRNAGVILQSDSELTIILNITDVNSPYSVDSQLAKEAQCQISDFIQQFFFAEIKILKGLWDDALTNFDHFHFLYIAKQRNLKILSCPKQSIIHSKDQCENGENSLDIKFQNDEKMAHRYRSFRANTLDNVKYFMKKFSLTKLIAEFGRETVLKGDEVKHTEDRDYLTLNSRAKKHQDYFKEIMLDINSDRTGWQFLKLDNSVNNQISVRKLQKCVYLAYSTKNHWTKGLKVNFDRPLNSKTQVLDYKRDLYVETCPFAEKLWKLNFAESNPINELIYITTSTGSDLLQRLIRRIDEISYQDPLVQVIIVWMGGPNDLPEKLVKQSSIPVHIVNVGPPFSRSIGMNKGYRYVDIVKTTENPVVFSVDDSMVLPDDFNEEIRGNVVCNEQAYRVISKDLLLSLNPSGNIFHHPVFPGKLLLS